MTPQQPFILYTRAHCHLCEQVIQMLEIAGLPWRPVDIDTDPELIRRYELRIPVLQRPEGGEELFYPFDERGLMEFAAGNE